MSQENTINKVTTDCHPRVLVIDNSPNTRRHILELLEEEGYCVQAADGEGKILSKNALAIAKTFRPHAAIIDLRIAGAPSLDKSRTRDDSGLELLEKLAQANCILRSAYLTNEMTRRALKEVGAFDVVEAQWSGERLLESVEDAARAKCACLKGFTVGWPDGWDSARVVKTLTHNEAQLDMAADILGQLFRKSASVHLQSIDGAVITPGSISQVYSVVFKAWPEGRHQPLLAKLTKAKQIQQESNNYDQYVRGNLGGQFHAILEGEPATFWDLGGVLYSFIGTSQDDLLTFSKHYGKSQTIEEIVSPLTHFFKHVWKSFYEEAKELEDSSLFETYNKVFELEDRLTNYSNQDEYYLFESIQLSLRNPVTWVLKHKQASTFHRMRQSITHGDLHGDNIFVNSDHAWAIDFGRTGPGHILRDFAELEVDIFTRMVNVPEKDLGDLLELAQTLIGSKSTGKELVTESPLPGNEEISKAFYVISELRKLAYEVTGYREAREYYWSLLFDSLFVATMFSGSDYQRRKAMLLASVICARLKNWGIDGTSEKWLKT